MFRGCCHLAAGLSVGLTGTAAGYAIGVVGDMVRENIAIKEPRITRTSRAFERICNSLECSSEWC